MMRNHINPHLMWEGREYLPESIAYFTGSFEKGMEWSNGLKPL